MRHCFGLRLAVHVLGRKRVQKIEMIQNSTKCTDFSYLRPNLLRTPYFFICSRLIAVWAITML